MQIASHDDVRIASPAGEAWLVEMSQLRQEILPSGFLLQNPITKNYQPASGIESWTSVVPNIANGTVFLPYVLQAASYSGVPVASAVSDGTDGSETFGDFFAGNNYIFQDSRGVSAAGDALNGSAEIITRYADVSMDPSLLKTVDVSISGKSSIYSMLSGNAVADVEIDSSKPTERTFMVPVISLL